MASVLSELATETKGKAIVGIVMVSQRDLVRAFGVSKIPTTFVIKNTEIISSFIGVVPKGKIQDTLKTI
jgi:thioredoxin 1